MHMARCSGPGGRVLHIHEVLKLALKNLCLCHHDPGGVLCHSDSVDCEPRHLRHDGSKPGDLYRTVPGGIKDVAMDVTTSSCTCPTNVVCASVNTDKHLRAAENVKFDKDLKSSYPLQASSSMRLVPLAVNQFGRRGPHFQAFLSECAELLSLFYAPLAAVCCLVLFGSLLMRLEDPSCVGGVRSSPVFWNGNILLTFCGLSTSLGLFLGFLYLFHLIRFP